MTGEAQRPTAPFLLPKTFRLVDGERQQVEAMIYEPTGVQIATLGRMMTALEHGEIGHEAVFSFAEMVASLFVEQADWNDFERLLIQGKLDNDEYGDFVQSIVRHFYPTEEEAPRTGPRQVPTRRKTTARRR